MSIVFILGAGASFGESLKPYAGGPPPICKTDATPPITTGYFNAEFFRKVGYRLEDAAQDFAAAFEYIRWLKQIKEDVPLGEGSWKSIDLEEILTSIELSREFQGFDSDAGARCILIRNELIEYVWRIIAYCTLQKYGIYSRKLVQSLNSNATLITFNYDLLLDQELIFGIEPGNQYGNSYDLLFEKEKLWPQSDAGLFLKMHGSLNWFRCRNTSCISNTHLELERDTSRCLRRAMGIHETVESCRFCGSDTIPLIVPPLLRKPITEDPTIRAIWGLARQKLSTANTVVLIGFSAAPTDFYASWLLRSTVGVRTDVQVFVVNPSNNPSDPLHEDFKRRMSGIFTAQSGADRLDQQFRTFSELDEIVKLFPRG